MAYPTISGTYGLLPIGLVGDRNPSGCIRQLPIASGYAASIGYGDFVGFNTVSNTGTIIRTDAAGAGAISSFATVPPVGVFLGCEYTDPNLKYKVRRQYYPASTTASDIVAYVYEDPFALFKGVYTNAGTLYTGTAATQALVGRNVGYYVPATAVNTTTGNSTVSLSVTNTTVTLPFRVVDVVKETALSDGTFVELLVMFNFPNTTNKGHAYFQPTGI